MKVVVFVVGILSGLSVLYLWVLLNEKVLTNLADEPGSIKTTDSISTRVASTTIPIATSSTTEPTIATEVEAASALEQDFVTPVNKIKKQISIPDISQLQPVITTTPNHPVQADFISQVIMLIEEATNKFRARNSLPTFASDGKLGASAHSYSRQLSIDGALSHIDSNGCDLTCRFALSGYKARAWGENLALMEFAERPTPEYIANFFMSEWEASSGHRKNLLSPVFTQQGIGITMDADSIYVAVHFAKNIDTAP